MGKQVGGRAVMRTEACSARRRCGWTTLGLKGLNRRQAWEQVGGFAVMRMEGWKRVAPRWLNYAMF